MGQDSFRRLLCEDSIVNNPLFLITSFPSVYTRPPLPIEGELVCPAFGFQKVAALSWEIESQ